jgi:hypothetical protein
MKRIIAAIGAATAALAASGLAQAQDAYPNRPIRVLIGYAAGGGNDIILRILSPELQKGLGQPIVVENKPGAMSIIAADYVAKAAPDGYTILVGPSGPMTINPATYSRLPYDAVRDFAPISLICQFPLLVTVDARLPIHNVKELIEFAKANPAKANYASSAGIFQITTELFKQKTGANFVMIPYKSSGESVQALVSGNGTAEGRHGARARRHLRQAPPVLARRADHGRGRRAGHGSAGVDGAVRAGEDAARDRGAAAAGGCARGASPRGAAGLRQDGARPGRRHFGRARPARAIGHRKVDRRREGGEHQERLAGPTMPG